MYDFRRIFTAVKEEQRSIMLFLFLNQNDSKNYELSESLHYLKMISGYISIFLRESHDCIRQS